MQPLLNSFCRCNCSHAFRIQDPRENSSVTTAVPRVGAGLFLEPEQTQRTSEKGCEPLSGGCYNTSIDLLHVF